MLLLRDAQPSDLPQLSRLAAALNTMNLPDNREALEGLIGTSVRSFSGEIAEPKKREYLFVLEDEESGRLWGTCMMIAQHGTYDAPHVYYEVGEREHYSASIGRHFRHRVLSIAYNYDGPTEIGGLVVDPEHRSQGAKPGKQLSYVRFLYLGMHRALFRQRVLAELLPPLTSDGRSLLWEACGQKFTGLTYQEADRLSRMNKEFIKELFPSSDIYATLLPDEAQAVLGEVGQQTRGVQRMLERIGFRYAERIDPFDGGPHFEANVGEITLVQKFLMGRVSERGEGVALDALVATERDGGPNRFRAVRCTALVEGEEVSLPADARITLGLSANEAVALIPFSH
ncbi:MAG TPA: arginine N-succinyltransferase [Myxococcaceae bacterium]|nr:arginine N-succinyltransferase [Myxococcaceae bacterium]